MVPSIKKKKRNELIHQHIVGHVELAITKGINVDSKRWDIKKLYLLMTRWEAALITASNGMEWRTIKVNLMLLVNI